MFASLVAALGTPRAVALVEMGDERPHVREFVEYHLAVGFSHLYVTLGDHATEEVRATLHAYSPDVAFVDANGTMVEGVHFFTGLTRCC